MTRNAAEQRVLDAIDFEGLLEYLCELVAVPSLTGHETPAQEHVAAQMERIGLDVDVWELDFDKPDLRRSLRRGRRRGHRRRPAQLRGDASSSDRGRHLVPSAPPQGRVVGRAI
jgi:acetylornithine deacetylase